MREELTNTRPANYSIWQRNSDRNSECPGDGRYWIDIDGVYWCRVCSEPFCITETISQGYVENKKARCMEALGRKAGVPVFVIGVYGSGDGKTLFVVQQRCPELKDPEAQTSRQHKEWVDSWYLGHCCKQA